MLRFVRIVFIVLLAPFSLSAQNADTALEHIRQLEGNWHGTMQWIGIQPQPSPLDATYTSTGADSARH